MPELPRTPVGDRVDNIVDWLTDNVNWLFDFISEVLQFFIDALEDLLTWPDPLVLIVIFALFAWWIRSAMFGLFTLLAMALVESMRLWEASMSSLSLVLVASLVAIVIGVPLGITTSRSTVVSTIVRPMLDFMQTMPAFVYLVPAIVFFGIGQVPGVVATVVFSMPPAVRFTELGIRQVDEEVVEAGHAFGSAPSQILTKIQLPLALPTIMAGINQVIMLALSMVVISGMVGAGGVGAVVFRGITRLDVGLGVEGGLAVVILAIFLDRITAAIGDRASQFRDRSAA
ncbi:MAG: proline/glycine betaine ABC transporter permease [Acidimicrobiales bacterium]|nr:proline/glycine betaine ABC transporter permease [Acidimicrobiales bacterium]